MRDRRRWLWVRIIWKEMNIIVHLRRGKLMRIHDWGRHVCDCDRLDRIQRGRGSYLSRLYTRHVRSLSSDLSCPNGDPKNLPQMEINRLVCSVQTQYFPSHLMSTTNLDLLTKSHRAISAKRRAKQNQVKEVVFDDNARRFNS